MYNYFQTVELITCLVQVPVCMAESFVSLPINSMAPWWFPYVCEQCTEPVKKNRCLKGYSSGHESHFSEIDAKLAEENKFVTHFVQKCLETRENEQNVVLNESSVALGNRSEIVRILVLAMTTADDDVGRSNSV